jgi:hypothetical protein
VGNHIKRIANNGSLEVRESARSCPHQRTRPALLQGVHLTPAYSDDLIHRGFYKARANTFALAVALAILAPRASSTPAASEAVDAELPGLALNVRHGQLPLLHRIFCS